MTKIGSLLGRRPTIWLGGLGLAFSSLWLLIGLTHVWPWPVVGWLSLPVNAVLAGHACWTVSRRETLDADTRRFWRRLAAACGFFTAGIVANAVDAVGGPVPSQRIGPVTLTLYMSVLAVVLGALFRLPSWRRGRGDWIRFGIDACIVLLTASTVLWHVSLSNHQQWVSQTGSAGAMLAIIVVGFVSVATFIKVAFAGTGHLERRSIHVLAIGSALSGVCGSLSPFLVHRPYLSSSLIAVPLAAFSIQLAAVGQRHAAGAVPTARSGRRRVGVAPFIAVAVADVLLLSTHSRHTRLVETVAVVLSGLVVTRQVLALRDNNKLLTTVDLHLDELRGYQQELIHQATHDSLTGLANRTLFEQRTRQLLAERHPFHVAVLDLDDFKTINDRLGHHAGDQVIVDISRRLTQTAGTDVSVARLGGDEFGLLLPVTTGLNDLLERLLRVVEQPIHVNAAAAVASAVSIGITTSTDGDEPAELLRRADVAMYAAKAAGGHRWNWFDQHLDDAADEAAQLSHELRHAVRGNQLFALYQPIVELPSGRPVGAEVLLRWQHPTRGLIPPDVFIPLAENSGTIAELGLWILEHACRQAAQWQHRHGPNAPGKISINVSARQLADPGFVDTVSDVLRATGADPYRLMIEVTETAVLNTDIAITQLHRLRALGLRIALDDFGTGHSSLSLLLDCPVDVLKVDKSFVSGDNADRTGAVIVKNLIAITTDFGIDAVAEGIETSAQADRLHHHGYRLAQGYLFHPPMTADAFEHTYTTQRAATDSQSPTPAA